MANFLIDSPKFKNCKILKINTVEKISDNFNGWFTKVTEKQFDEELIKSLYSFFHHYLNEMLEAIEQSFKQKDTETFIALINNLRTVAQYYSHERVISLLDINDSPCQLFAKRLVNDLKSIALLKN